MEAFSVIVKSSRRFVASSSNQEIAGPGASIWTRWVAASPVPNLRPESSSAVPASGSGTPRLRPPGPRLVRCGAIHTLELWHQVIKVLDIKP